jgi:hypothetical protein
MTATTTQRTALHKALNVNKNGFRQKETNAAKAAAQARRSTRIGAASANALVISDMQRPSIRKGSMDALAHPSRVGDVLHYRNGEVKFDPIPTQAPVNPYAAFNRS